MDGCTISVDSFKRRGKQAAGELSELGEAAVEVTAVAPRPGQRASRPADKMQHQPMVLEILCQ